MSLPICHFRFSIFVPETLKFKKKQECIPVGCVPAAQGPYTGVGCGGGQLGDGCIPEEIFGKNN